MLEEKYHFGILRGMTLAEYLDTTGTTATALAEAIGKTQAAVSRYANGKRFPDKETILRIEAATGKRVSAIDWYAENAA